jgi:hypothetical protein
MRSVPDRQPRFARAFRPKILRPNGLLLANLIEPAVARPSGAPAAASPNPRTKEPGDHEGRRALIVNVRPTTGRATKGSLDTIASAMGITRRYTGTVGGTCLSPIGRKDSARYIWRHAERPPH